MRIGKIMCIVLLAAGGLTACRNSKINGDNSIHFSDFLQRFPDFTVPFSFHEDSLAVSEPDSVRFIYKEAAAFIPDSLWYPGGKDRKEAKIFPIGRNRYGSLELLLIRSGNPPAERVDLLVYGKADTLTAVLPLINKRHVPAAVTFFRLDKNYLLHLNEWKNSVGGEVIKKEDVYAFDKDGGVTLIMTNTNQPANPNTYYNPIDTLPRESRYAGDYFIGKSDLVSIRDGETKGSFRFFIHLNKNGGDCTGELDGVGSFKQAATGVFRDDDGPCAIQFTFSGNKVTITETGGCGAYRGIGCNFSGTYTRKKEAGSRK